jgi:glutathione S-transferase
LIVQYLEHIAPEPALLPADGVEHALRKTGLALGMIDATVYIVAGTRFGAGANDPLRGRRLAAIRRVLPAHAEALAGAHPRPDLGDLAAGVALGYLDLRLAELDWRRDHPDLARWHDLLAARPAMAETRPPG